LARDESLLDPILERVEHYDRVSRDGDLRRRLQRSRLNRFLHDTVAPSPYYQDGAVQRVVRLDDPASAFEALPPLEKLRLREMAREEAQDKDPSAYFRARSTGSTGVPLEMWFDDGYFVGFYAGLLHYLTRIGVWPQPLRIGLLSVGVMPKRVYDRDDYSFPMPALNYALFQRINIRAHPPAQIVSFLASSQPLVIRGVTSSLLELASLVNAHPELGAIRPRLVLPTAETLLPAMRGDLEQTFAAPVRDEYGLSEVGGFVARECGVGGGYHVVDDFVLEVVDRNGISVPPGDEGEVLITNLYATPLPILRYRTGDHGVLTDEPCPCGWSSQRLERFTGRDLCRFVLPDGRQYNPFDAFREFLLGLPVQQFQMIQRSNAEIALRYVGDRAVADLDAVRGLGARVVELHGPHAAFRVERVERIERMEGGRKFHAFLRLDEHREPAVVPVADAPILTGRR